MLEDFAGGEPQVRVRLQHESDQVFGAVAGTIPVRSSKVESARQDRIEQLFLIIGRTDERWVAAQQNINYYAHRPHVDLKENAPQKREREKCINWLAQTRFVFHLGWMATTLVSSFCCAS